MQKKQSNRVQSTETIISLTKSKRLAAIRKSVEQHNEKVEIPSPPVANKNNSQVEQARKAIRESMLEIKAGYPQGMQNKLFALTLWFSREN